MQLIKPKQISGEIMTLLEEADKQVIIVCPYYKVTKWYKLLNCLEELKKRKIDIEFYVREKEWESINELEAIGFTPIAIKNLHTKLYKNDKYAIVSSMNLHVSSDTNSLDIALKTQTVEEYEELVNYYKRYIKNHSFPPTPVINTPKIIIQSLVNKQTTDNKNLENSNSNNVLPAFLDFQLNALHMQNQDWKTIICYWIGRIFNYKTPGHHMHDGKLYFRTTDITFMCFFETYSRQTSFKIRWECNATFLEQATKHLSYLQNETDADIIVSNPKDSDYLVNIISVLTLLV